MNDFQKIAGMPKLGISKSDKNINTNVQNALAKTIIAVIALTMFTRFEPRTIAAENVKIGKFEAKEVDMTYATGAWSETVTGNGFAFTAGGDSEISQSASVTVTFSSYAANTEVSTQSVMIKPGNVYYLSSELEGNWTVSIPDASSTLKGVQIFGL